MVNDWDAAKELQSFKTLYIDPSDKKLSEARKIFFGPRRWQKGEKDRALAKLKRMEGENINFHQLYSAVSKLIEQHEAQTDMLTEIYAQWYSIVAYEGGQPAELMKMQKDTLFKIFQRIYKAIEPLNLKLTPPRE